MEHACALTETTHSQGFMINRIHSDTLTADFVDGYLILNMGEHKPLGARPSSDRLTILRREGRVLTRDLNMAVNRCQLAALTVSLLKDVVPRPPELEVLLALCARPLEVAGLESISALRNELQRVREFLQKAN